APVAAELIAVVRNLVAIEAGDRGDDELSLVGLLEGIELLGERGVGRRIDDVGEVERRRGTAIGKLRLGEGWARQRDPQQGEECGKPLHHAASLARPGALSLAGRVGTAFIFPIIMSSAAARPRL